MFRRVTVVPAPPKTRSGKTTRLVEGRDEPMSVTIDDPAALDVFRVAAAG